MDWESNAGKIIAPVAEEDGGGDGRNPTWEEQANAEDNNLMGNILAGVGNFFIPTASAAVMTPLSTAVHTKLQDESFNLALGENMETWHSATPQPTNDASESDKPEKKRSKDVAYGHKVTDAEEESGFIHGIPFKENGQYIEISREDGMKILRADLEKNLKIARTATTGGWDKKLKERYNTTWEELDPRYRRALASLAFNVGGAKAAAEWTEVLRAAKEQNLSQFAWHLRRQDRKKNTAGMDNRVAKELYYSGLITSLADVKNKLPLANAEVAGIPAVLVASN